MEWIRINSNKLKIMLTAEDAARYALRPESANLADAVTRRAFREILSDTGEQIGFNAKDERVYIQMYPSIEGGCELFVTKMGIPIREEGEINVPTAKKVMPKSASLHLEERRLVFCFTCMQELIAVCRRLLHAHFHGESRVLVDDEHRFWLLISDSGNPLTAREEYGFVLEYGAFENRNTAELLLAEHGKEICNEHAVEQLGVL